MFIAALAALGIWKRQERLHASQKNFVTKGSCDKMHDVLDKRVAEMKDDLEDDIRGLHGKIDRVDDNVTRGNDHVIAILLRNGFKKEG